MPTAVNSGPRYYSQHGEDRWLVKNLKLPEKGVFVEVGAFDGVNLSNTKHFEEKGWTGLCIEADPRQWHKLLVNRTCQKFFGAAGSNPDLVFDMHSEPTWSGFGRGGQGIKVPVFPLGRILTLYGLGNVLDSPGAIDILSLDTEGTELDIWDSGYFGLHPIHHLQYPRVVIIEWETAGLPSNEDRIKEHFSKLPYELVHRNVGNLIFERV